MHKPERRTDSGPNTWAAEVRASLTLGWPLILTNLAQIALVTTDIIYMGQLGPDALAAGSLAASLYHTVMIFSMGLVSATIPMLATTLGRRRNAVREVRRTVRQGLWTAVLICIPAWLMLWQAEHILIFMGQDPAMVAKSMEFMRTLQWALLPYLGYIVLRSFLAAMERPAWTLLVAGTAIAFNALAGWVLIFGHWGFPALGLEGAGIASTCSSAMMFLGLMLVVRRHKRFRRYHLMGKIWRADFPRLAELWRLGIPIAITFTLETMVFYAAVVMMGILGTEALAAHAIAMQVASISFMVPLGFGQVATIRVGLAAGRGQTARMLRAGWTAYALGVGFMGVAAMLMWLAPSTLIGFFLDTTLAENVQVVQLAVQFLAWAALFQLADGAQAVSAGMLRGLHDTRVPMALAAFGYWILGVPIGAFLAFVVGWGGVGVWVGLATGLTVVAFLLTRRWIRRTRPGFRRGDAY